MTPELVKALTLCSKKERSLIRRRISQRQWAAKWRAENPVTALERARKQRQKFVELGYYRKGGKYYSPHDPTNPKRLEYFRQYNATRRKQSHV